MKTKKSIKYVGKFFIMFVMTYIMLACTAIPACAYTATPQSIETSTDTSVTVLADTDTTNNNGWTNIKTWITNVSSNLKIVGYAIAGVAVIALGILLITGGGQALQKGKGMAIGILVGIAVLSFGTSLISSLM